MNRIVPLIGIGGMLGSILRYLVASSLFKLIPYTFPYGTFIVNMSGCVLIGFISGLSLRYDWLKPELRLFLITGFCGGYTTFSSFAFENFKLLQDKDYITFGLYSFISFAGSLVAVLVGLYLTKISF
jgi:CrcB protein